MNKPKENKYYWDVPGPSFNYIRDRKWPWNTRVTSTHKTVTAYKEQYGDIAWLKPGTVLGYVDMRDGQVDVYHPIGSLLGKTTNKLSAAEELLRLYVLQNRV